MLHDRLLELRRGRHGGGESGETPSNLPKHPNRVFLRPWRAHPRKAEVIVRAEAVETSEVLLKDGVRFDDAALRCLGSRCGVGTAARAPHVAMPSSISGEKAFIGAESMDATAACSATATRRSGLASCARNHKTLSVCALYARIRSPKHPETVRKCDTRLCNLSTGAAQAWSSVSGPNANQS